MADERLVETLQRYIAWDNVELRDGVLHVSFSQADRRSLLNIGSSGKSFHSPTISFDHSTTNQTFFVMPRMVDDYHELMAEPIVFHVTGFMDKGVMAEYEHWTKAGILHREGGPAYQSWYDNPVTDQKDRMEMYFCAGLLQRDRGPAISIYKNIVERNHHGEGEVIQFDNAIFECRHIPGQEDLDYFPDECMSQSWPYVHRLSLQRGQQLMTPGADGRMTLREIAALRATAKWQIPSDVQPGYYPNKMVMQKFHEFWENGVLQTRIIGGKFESHWVRMDSEDKRPLPEFSQRRNTTTNASFDRLFKPMMSKVGITDKPFYDDANVEFAVLTDLPAALEELRRD